MIKLPNNLRKYVGFILIALTVSIFGIYLKNHPDTFKPLFEVPFATIPILLILYFFFLMTNYLITVITIKACGKSFPNFSSFLLTIYSTVVNFFGPLQSGPGFRAVYLKAKLGIRIKEYTLITLIYYACFAFISICMLFVPTFPWLFIPITLVFAGLLVYGRKNILKGGMVGYLIKPIFLITVLQLIVVSAIYFIGLKAVGADIDLKSLLAYTGSANLALFVSFTPGAIGIRESFIYFAQSIHGIPTQDIINASIIDRSIYVVFLLMLFVFSALVHVKDKLNPKS